MITFIASGPKEWYNSLLLYGYGAYNCPNRTTYKDGKSLSGYGYDDIFQLAGGVYNTTIAGTMKDLASINDGEGSDRMFKGAETEYLLVGSNSEIMNQSATFFNLFLFRLALDLPAVLMNKEVSTIAMAAGPAAWVVKVLIALIEPLLDTFILINDGEVFLFKKDKVYCSFSGFVLLQNDLIGITSIGEGLKDKLKDVVKASNGTPVDKGIFKTSYTEHLILLMILAVDQTTYLQRLQNLIQMETACSNASEYNFNLDNTYTYIYSNVEYTLNPMFNLDELTQNGLFHATSRQYTGY